MEAAQLLFLSPPSPWKKEYLIARWSSFLKQRLVIKSVALVGEKGHEQSNMRFLVYRDEAKISCNMEMY